MKDDDATKDRSQEELKILSEEVASKIIMALIEDANRDDLTPEMFIPPMAIQLWDRLCEEDRVRAIWFHPNETRPVPNHFYSINPMGYFWNA